MTKREKEVESKMQEIIETFEKDPLRRGLLFSAFLYRTRVADIEDYESWVREFGHKPWFRKLDRLLRDLYLEHMLLETKRIHPEIAKAELERFMGTAEDRSSRILSLIFNSKEFLSEKQNLIYEDNSRFIVLVAGRRFGKTTLATYIMRKWAFTKAGKYAYISPTWKMSRSIFWEPLLEKIPPEYIKNALKNTLELYLTNGSIIKLYGAQNYDNIRGEGFDGVIIDECKDIPREAWFEVVRPALTDKKGRALIIGTPQGMNDLLFDIWNQEDFKKYKFTTAEGGWVTDEEIEKARKELDERTFRQEFEAEFIENAGNVYYAFSTENIQDYKFNPSEDVYLSWDFNVGERPMSCILLQRNGDKVYAFHEFVLKQTNTHEMVQIVASWLKEQNTTGKIWITGDYAGNKMTSSATRSDYDIIISTLRERGFQAWTKVKPVRSIRARVIALNSYFCNTQGERRLFVSPKCKKLIEDLKYTLWKENGAELDDRNPERTHPSDALSYYVYNFGETRSIEIL